MKLIILKIIFALSLSYDMGQVGRYQIEVQTKNGEEYTANFVIATYDKLESEFKSNTEFKDFLFNIYGLAHLDSLRLFKDFYYINYPEYSFRSEKLTAVLKEDRIKVSKKDIEEIRFISLDIIDHTGLVTQLNLNEIRLLQTEPVYIESYSIDAYQEAYSGLWILSYNEEMESEEIKRLMHEFKEEYEISTVNCNDNENYWIYREMIYDWQIELKEEKIYLIEVISP